MALVFGSPVARTPANNYRSNQPPPPPIVLPTEDRQDNRLDDRRDDRLPQQPPLSLSLPQQLPSKTTDTTITTNYNNNKNNNKTNNITCNNNSTSNNSPTTNSNDDPAAAPRAAFLSTLLRLSRPQAQAQTLDPRDLVNLSYADLARWCGGFGDGWVVGGYGRLYEGFVGASETGMAGYGPGYGTGTGTGTGAGAGPVSPSRGSKGVPGGPGGGQAVRFCVARLTVRLTPPGAGTATATATASYSSAGTTSGAGVGVGAGAGPSLRSRFAVQREVEALAALTHPNVARIVGYSIETAPSAGTGTGSRSGAGSGSNRDTPSDGSSSSSSHSSSSSGSGGRGGVDCLVYDQAELGSLEGLLRRSGSARALTWRHRVHIAVVRACVYVCVCVFCDMSRCFLLVDIV
jgi:hypothetical protein